jgi:hypothetical protein
MSRHSPPAYGSGTGVATDKGGWVGIGGAGVKVGQGTGEDVAVGVGVGVAARVGVMVGVAVGMRLGSAAN